MNKWQCDQPECDSTAVGIGGANGLRGIGWCIVYGGTILCPAHRSEPKPTAEYVLEAQTESGEWIFRGDYSDAQSALDAMEREGIVGRVVKREVIGTTEGS